MDIELEIQENPKQETEINKFLQKISSGSKPQKFDETIIEMIYKNKIFGRNFSAQALSKLDLACYLENYLIPCIDTAKGSSFFLSIIALINFKNKSNIFFWDYMKNNSED